MGTGDTFTPSPPQFQVLQCNYYQAGQLEWDPAKSGDAKLNGGFFRHQRWPGP